MAIDWDSILVGLARGLPQGIETGMNVWKTQTENRRREQADSDERTYRNAQIREREADRDERKMQNAYGKFKDTVARDDELKARRGRGKAARAMLASSAKGRELALSLPGDLRDEDFGDRRVLSSFDDIARMIADPRPVESPEAKSARELEEFEKKEVIRAKHRPPRRTGGGGASSPESRAGSHGGVTRDKRNLAARTKS
jgi:hypothetical protein